MCSRVLGRSQRRGQEVSSRCLNTLHAEIEQPNTMNGHYIIAVCIFVIALTPRPNPGGKSVFSRNQSISPLVVA